MPLTVAMGMPVMPTMLPMPTFRPVLGMLDLRMVDVNRALHMGV